MRRKIYDKLLKWKNEEQGRVALLIDGARRVGKSFIVEEFAKKEYDSYLLIDFSNVNKDVIGYFHDYSTDLDALFLHLGTFYHVTLKKRKSLVIFDEIQFFPQARALIKHLVADGRFDYIETGSLVSIRKNVKDILIPSEERHLKMYPMDFEEFLWALGEELLMPFVRNCLEGHLPLGNALHRRAMGYFRQYMLVGGMPQAVAEYANSRDFIRTDQVKHDILELYRSDIHKFATRNETKILKIFDSIPGQLQKHEKKFTLSSLAKGSRYRNYESSFKWLEEAMVVNVCYRTTEPNIGFALSSDDSTFKCYMGDTGLLVTQAFGYSKDSIQEICSKIILDKLEINKGMLVENIVAQSFRASEKPLFFYSSYSKDNSQECMEIDFLLCKKNVTNRHNIIPVEVKSGPNYSFSSLQKCMVKYKNQISSPIIIHSADYKEENGIVFIPIYMTSLL